MQQHATPASQVFGEGAIAFTRGEFAVISDEDEAIIFQPHTASRDIVLRRVVDGETVLHGQLVEKPPMVNVGKPLIEAVEKMIEAALPAAHDRG